MDGVRDVEYSAVAKLYATTSWYGTISRGVN